MRGGKVNGFERVIMRPGVVVSTSIRIGDVIRVGDYLSAVRETKRFNDMIAVETDEGRKLYSLVQLVEVWT